MTQAVFTETEHILRASPGAVERLTPRQAARLLLCFLLCTMAYGALMGTFGGVRGDRALMVLYGALKVPVLLIVTGLVCFPSFFVLNTLFGVREDFSHVLRALLFTQAGFAMLLLSLAPYTLLGYASSADHTVALLVNSLVFTVASGAAQWLLRRHYRPLIARNERHAWLLHIWLGLFAFVGIQTAWMLRPFVGAPHLAPQFFRQEAWGNAYVELGSIFARLFQ